MSANKDPEPDVDLDSYIDNQLGPADRITVETFLSQRPAAAAQMMSDLRVRDELRFALAGANDGASPAIDKAARRLERGLRRDSIGSMVRFGAAVVLLLAAGWVANDMLDPLHVSTVAASTPPPAYVADAVQAYRTSTLRLAMASQLEAPNYNAKEIRSATGIVMPVLPPDWRVLDVQVFPSQFGPSVAVSISSRTLGALSLFAVRPGPVAFVHPTLAPDPQATSAYFQVGEVAYTIVSAGSALEIEAAAKSLATQFAMARTMQWQR